jgi:hypothetical protein
MSACDFEGAGRPSLRDTIAAADVCKNVNENRRKLATKLVFLRYSSSKMALIMKYIDSMHHYMDKYSGESC